MATPEIIARLRAATGAAHARLEAALDLVERVADAGERRRLVAGFLALHEGAEARLAPWLAPHAGLEPGTRLRASLIRADLALLGGAVETDAPQAPEVGSLGRALGWLYVLEGSTLGGRTIHRALETRGLDARGLGFLNPYGEAAGARWRAFVAELDRLHRTGEADRDEIVAGGVDGFEHASKVLCGA
ncbi:heme oxygenase [Brevundimonas alba]|uniref:Heme oxygenase n=1 Tax=Brevundimonas alba TaxID=74314 RepID=A0A7X5YJW3_9CAUL|nr:biliverdin-producing heme oxygenase [Brevundimonas alba]NJC40561.1 heme oxygenase [Brevundimonas alba]